MRTILLEILIREFDRDYDGKTEPLLPGEGILDAYL